MRPHSVVIVRRPARLGALMAGLLLVGLLVLGWTGDAAASTIGNLTGIGGSDPFSAIGGKVDTGSGWLFRFIQIVGIGAFLVAIGTLFINKANKVWIISCVIGLIIVGTANTWVSWVGLGSGSTSPFANLYQPSTGVGAELPAGSGGQP